MEEIYKDIEGYEGLYQVSNLGNVKSLVDNKGVKREKILCKSKDKDGYIYVKLFKQGKRKNYLVHRLVANSFLPNPHNFPCVNHKDENKQNNSVINIEWCTHKYNCNFGTRNKRMSESQINHPNKSKQVYQYSKDGVLISVFNSTRECGRQGFCQVAVAACCRNCYIRPGNNVYKGYIWSYDTIE